MSRSIEWNALRRQCVAGPLRSDECGVNHAGDHTRVREREVSDERSEFPSLACVYCGVERDVGSCFLRFRIGRGGGEKSTKSAPHLLLRNIGI